LWKKSLEKCSDFKAVSYGWGIENDFPVKGGEEGQLGSILTTFISWPSTDAYMKFRGTEAFKEKVNSIRTMDGIITLALFHISCRSLGRKTE